MSDSTLQTYNGWTNRETWLVNVWLNNDEISYKYMRSILRGGDSLQQAKEINQYLDELLEDGSITLWKDLMREVLCKVNWQEIVSSQ